MPITLTTLDSLFPKSGIPYIAFVLFFSIRIQDKFFFLFLWHKIIIKGRKDNNKAETIFPKTCHLQQGIRHRLPSGIPDILKT